MNDASIFEPWLSRWHLDPDGAEIITASARLLPVLRGGVQAMLKIADDPRERGVADLMRWWNGRGAARVLASDGEALLIERASGLHSLTQMSSDGADDTATGILCTVLDELHRPRAEHDPQMEQHARFFLDAIPRRIDAVSESLREAIKSLLPHGRHSMAGVAALMGYTARSMQRHLAQAGTSYQQALNEVRRQLAAELLADARHSVGDAAAATGFAEVSAFSRWFSAEFSCSPSAWRRLHGG